MRNSTFTTLALAAVTSAGLNAQTPTNVIGNDPGTVTTVLFGENTDVLQPYYAEQWRGVGQVSDGMGGVVGRLTEFEVWVQDEQTNTQEPFTVVVVPDDGTGQPDANPANELIRTVPVGFPIGFGGGGAQAATLTLTLATPFDGLPEDQNFYVGVGLGAAPSFPLDGVSVWGTDESPTGPMAMNPFNWFIDRNGVPLVQSFPPQFIPRTSVRVENPVLRIGTRFDPILALTVPDPNFGPVGTYRDLARGDALTFRVEDAARPNSVGALFISLQAFSPVTLPFNFIEGRFLIDFITLLPAQIPFVTDMDGQAQFDVGMVPNMIRVGNSGYQVVVFDAAGGTLHASNAQSVIE